MSLTERNLAFLMAHLQELADKQKRGESDRFDLPNFSYLSSSTATPKPSSPPSLIEMSRQKHEKARSNCTSWPRPDQVQRPMTLANMRKLTSSGSQNGVSRTVEPMRKTKHSPGAHKDQAGSGACEAASEGTEHGSNESRKQAKIKAWARNVPIQAVVASIEHSPKSERSSQIPVRVKRPTAVLRPKSSTPLKQTVADNLSDSGEEEGGEDMRRSGRIRDLKGQMQLAGKL